MDKALLKKLTYWISYHGFSSYTPKTVAHDLNIDIQTIQILSTPALVLDSVLSSALSTAQERTAVQYPSTEDELFDLILTFFEELSDYKDDLNKIFNKQRITLGYINIMPRINKLSTEIFHASTQTFLDKLTYNVLFLKIFYVWLNDATEDFSHTSHQINHIAKIIYSQP